MKKEKKIKPEKNKNGVENREKFGTKFVNTIKKRWLISGTNTILLIAILIAITILINTFVQSLELTPIDCTSNKQYTLTEESKERIKNIEDKINVYIVGFTEEDAEYTLMKQYNKANPNINVELINTEERIYIAEKYQITNEYSAIIVENGEKSKIITSDELYTTDDDWNTVDLTEEKITSAILNVTSEDIPKVYFLTGYSNMTLENGLYYLNLFMQNEVNEVESVDLLTTGKVPDDCDTLVITMPSKDFDNLATNSIIEYINKGGNILWFQAAIAQNIDMPNSRRSDEKRALRKPGPDFFVFSGIFQKIHELSQRLLRLFLSRHIPERDAGLFLHVHFRRRLPDTHNAPAPALCHHAHQKPEHNPHSHERKNVGEEKLQNPRPPVVNLRRKLHIVFIQHILNERRVIDVTGVVGDLDHRHLLRRLRLNVYDIGAKCHLLDLPLLQHLDKFCIRDFLLRIFLYFCIQEHDQA